MAYNRRDIKDRVAQGDRKYDLVQLPDGRIELTPHPDSITEPGTDINKALLQPMEDAIDLLDGAAKSTDGMMSSNSDDKLPTEKAVVTYVGERAGVFALATQKITIGEL